jgi:hypothetical protein
MTHMWFHDVLMWLLPMALRAKMATVILLGIFFVPFATSDLRGLTHVLTCTDAVSASLLVDDTTDGDTAPVLGSADTVTREEVGLGLCGGLEVDLQLTSAEDGRAEVLVAVTNSTEHDWKGSIELRFDDTPVPVAIGSIDRGDTERDTVELRVKRGAAYEITGTLLIGP